MLHASQESLTFRSNTLDWRSFISTTAGPHFMRIVLEVIVCTTRLCSQSTLVSVYIARVNKCRSMQLQKVLQIFGCHKLITIFGALENDSLLVDNHLV